MAGRHLPMITIPVDEAYAFDYLSILMVKGQYGQYGECLDHLKSQLGNICLMVVKSPEYERILSVNSRIFQEVECMRSGYHISPETLDRLNLDRWKAKEILQSKFFDNRLTETKTPVTKYEDSDADAGAPA